MAHWEGQGEPGLRLAPSGVGHVSSLHKVTCNLDASLSDEPPRPQLGGLSALSMQINQDITNPKKSSFYMPIKQNMVFSKLPFKAEVHLTSSPTSLELPFASRWF